MHYLQTTQKQKKQQKRQEQPKTYKRSKLELVIVGILLYISMMTVAVTLCFQLHFNIITTCVTLMPFVALPYLKKRRESRAKALREELQERMKAFEKAL